MKAVRALVILMAVMSTFVATVNAQKVYAPGKGVSLPIVIKRVDHIKADEPASVLLGCVVRDDGKVTDIRVLNSPDSQLNQTAIDALSQWLFRPGTKQGKAVAVRISVELTFDRRP